MKKPLSRENDIGIYSVFLERALLRGRPQICTFSSPPPAGSPLSVGTRRVNRYRARLERSRTLRFPRTRRFETRVEEIVRAFWTTTETYRNRRIPGARYEFTKNLSREALQSISGLFVVALHLRASAPCGIQKAGVSHPIFVDTRGTHRDQIHPRVHYYPCIVSLNIDSIAFE